MKIKPLLAEGTLERKIDKLFDEIGTNIEINVVDLHELEVTITLHGVHGQVFKGLKTFNPYKDNFNDALAQAYVIAANSMVAATSIMVEHSRKVAQLLADENEVKEFYEFSNAHLLKCPAFEDVEI